MRHSKMKPTAAWSELLGGVASRRHPKTKPTGAGSELLIGVASPRHAKMKPTGAGSELLIGVASRRHAKTKPTGARSELLIGVASRLYRYDDRRGLNDIWKRVDPRFQYGPSSRTRSYAKLCNGQSNKSMFSARELKYSHCIRRPLRKGNFFT